MHALAAVPGLARSVSARVLEAMDVVEGDFRASVGEGTLGADLETLRSAADDALRALGMEVPRCGP